MLCARWFRPRAVALTSGSPSEPTGGRDADRLPNGSPAEPIVGRTRPRPSFGSHSEPIGRCSPHGSLVGSSSEPPARIALGDGTWCHLTERLFGLRILLVNPQRGPTVERPERPLPSASSGSAPLRPNTGRDERNKCRAGRPTRDRAREKGNRTTTVLSRTTTASLAGRSSSMRRQRRRVMHSNRPYCRTNGCASFLEVDPITGTASCPICGYMLRPH